MPKTSAKAGPSKVSKPRGTRRQLRNTLRELLRTCKAGKHLRASNKKLNTALGPRARYDRIIGVDDEVFRRADQAPAAKSERVFSVRKHGASAKLWRLVVTNFLRITMPIKTFILYDCNYCSNYYLICLV